MKGSCFKVLTLVVIFGVLNKVSLAGASCKKKFKKNMDNCGAMTASWSPWYDRDDPMDDGVENEDIDGQVKMMSKQCQTARLGAQCRVKGTDDYVVSGAVAFGDVKLKFPWLCVPDRGLRCLNSEQSEGVTCPDFEIRYLCPDEIPM